MHCGKYRMKLYFSEYHSYIRPKTKRVGRYIGKTKAVGKAYVKIKAGQDIDLFGEAEAK